MSTSHPFALLGLSPALVSSLTTLGYESPTPIQEQSIPILLEGNDILAQAQTGTGKTAAFALPVLQRIDLKLKKPQSLIIAPTRELAIQVAQAFKSYAKELKGFNVTPIYGGQDYKVQLKALERGAHVIVGTPGRVMDHLRRGTLVTDALQSLVLDEADEMLKMGFIEDVEWILEQIPNPHQTALFSATIPTSIQKIAKRYLNNPEKILIKPQEGTVTKIDQVYIRAANPQKFDVLTRLLEVEPVEAVIVFTRTKTTSGEIADKLQTLGYSASALNGDMNQGARKKTVDRIKKGLLDIVVATDVAARGIDVPRISHVINYDMPHDSESYIHRIGRTGRAGRQGKAILLVTPKEQRALRELESAIHKPITMAQPPSVAVISELRNQQLTETLCGIIAKSKRLSPYRDMVETVKEQSQCEGEDVAAALAYLMQQSNPLPTEEIKPPKPEKNSSSNNSKKGRRGKPSSQPRSGKSSGQSRSGKSSGPSRKRTTSEHNKKPRKSSKRR